MFSFPEDSTPRGGMPILEVMNGLDARSPPCRGHVFGAGRVPARRGRAPAWDSPAHALVLCQQEPSNV